MSDVPLLIADQLVAGYLPGVDVLNTCSIELFDGEIVGIIGPNGAGKSTLLKAILGMVEVRSGAVILRGEDITGLATHQLVERGVGYVPQTANVFPRMSVRENLEMGAFQRPRIFAAQWAKVTELFPRLAERENQRAGNLSGGERQMVAMSRALMASPDILLLDEPSAGLSPALQRDVFHQVATINKAGVTVLMVEQNARSCLQVADRGYVFDQGANAYTDTGRALMHDPKVVELYLGTLARRS